jgi:hypothetical protein
LIYLAHVASYHDDPSNVWDLLWREDLDFRWAEVLLRELCRCEAGVLDNGVGAERVGEGSVEEIVGGGIAERNAVAEEVVDGLELGSPNHGDYFCPCGTGLLALALGTDQSRYLEENKDFVALQALRSY